jgi:death on curing protein
MAIHEAQLAEHGGSAGLRDQGQIHAYSEHPTLTKMAAAYAFGLAKNHAFADGNKRTAWIVCATFLPLT